MLKYPAGVAGFGSFEVAPFAAYSSEQFDGAPTIFETDDRKDDRLRAGVGGVYYLNQSWSVEGNAQYTQNTSTSELYDYTQYSVSAGVAWKF